MKKVFLDTNVLLDFVLARDGEQQATDVFQLAEEGRVQLYVSYLTMANVAYVARKHRTRAELYAYLSELAAMFKILTNDEEQYLQALTHQVPDFEDYLQCVCAQTFDCDVILTNNTDWKSHARLTPEDKFFLTPLGKIRLTPCGKIKMAPENFVFSGAFFSFDL